MDLARESSGDTVKKLLPEELRSVYCLGVLQLLGLRALLLLPATLRGGRWLPAVCGGRKPDNGGGRMDGGGEGSWAWARARCGSSAWPWVLSIHRFRRRCTLPAAVLSPSVRRRARSKPPLLLPRMLRPRKLLPRKLLLRMLERLASVLNERLNRAGSERAERADSTGVRRSQLRPPG